MTKETSFVWRWTGLVSAAFFAGYALYTPIGHGITGGHDRQLSSAQFAAHCVALAVVGLLVSGAQRRALAPFVHIGWGRVATAVLGFVGAFWVGYYQTAINGPDMDILLAYLVLGSAVWLGRLPIRSHAVATSVAVLSYPVASFVGELLVFAGVVLFDVTPNFSQDRAQHSAFWLTVGVTTGVLGGWMSGLALRRILRGMEADTGAHSDVSASPATR